MKKNCKLFLLFTFFVFSNTYPILETREDIDAKKAYDVLLEEIESGPKDPKNYISVTLPIAFIKQFKKAQQEKNVRDASLMPKQKTLLAILGAQFASPFVLLYDRYCTDLGEYFKTEEDAQAELMHKKMVKNIKHSSIHGTSADNPGYIEVKLSTVDTFAKTQKKQEERNEHWKPKRKTMAVIVGFSIILSILKSKLGL